MRKSKTAGDEIVMMDRRSTNDRRTEPVSKTADKKTPGGKAATSKTSHGKPANKAPSPKAVEPERAEPVVKRSPTDRRGRESAPDNMAKLIAEEKRKVKVQRRRQIDPTTCERDYSDDEIAFMQAMDEYKRKNGRMFPTCSEILEVVRSIGYVKVAPAEPIPNPSLD